MSTDSIVKYIDHTLLRPGSTCDEIATLCQEAKDYGFASVCVNPFYVALASESLRGSGIKVCTVIGFPLGSTTTITKVIEARDAVANGADELDMVMNLAAFKSGKDELVKQDIRAVVEAAAGRIVKVIIETGLLTDDEKVRAATLVKEAGAHFVKTCTGFSDGRATVEDIRLLRKTVGPDFGVKASGRVRDYVTAKAMIEAGATRIGATASVKIAQEERSL
ncbi:MAG TPA: deoxyribose-phosphate aldolase [Firmicutes bacterium]|nr:deoxyribose-phosphate aldolase [Bacillota bacterium]